MIKKINSFAEEINHVMDVTNVKDIYMSWPVFIDQFTNLKDGDFDDGDDEWEEDLFILNSFRSYINNFIKNEKHLPYKKLKETMLNKSINISKTHYDPKENLDKWDNDDMRSFTRYYSVITFYRYHEGQWRLFFSFYASIEYHN